MEARARRQLHSPISDNYISPSYPLPDAYSSLVVVAGVVVAAVVVVEPPFFLASSALMLGPIISTMVA